MLGLALKEGPFSLLHHDVFFSLCHELLSNYLPLPLPGAKRMGCKQWEFMATLEMFTISTEAAPQVHFQT